MSRLLLAALLWAPLAALGQWYVGTTPPDQAPTWRVGTTIGVSAANASRPTAIFANSAHPDYTPPRGTWLRTDVTRWGVPEDALAVFLSGLLLVTKGQQAGICNVTVTFRAPGNDLDPGNYILQAIESTPGGGQRSNASTWVPVRDGQIEWQWNTAGDDVLWPTGCALGANLKLQAWVR